MLAVARFSTCSLNPNTVRKSRSGARRKKRRSFSAHPDCRAAAAPRGAAKLRFGCWSLLECPHGSMILPVFVPENVLLLLAILVRIEAEIGHR